VLAYRDSAVLASGFYRIKEGGVNLVVNIDEKKRIVDDLHERFIKSKVVILTDYNGLNVPKINDLRRRLLKVESEFKVAKNSLFKRAAQDTDAALIEDAFKGPTAVALSYDDPVASAKVLSEFAKEHPELEIQAGVLNGKVIGLSEIKALSVLPSREVLLGQLLSVINGVPTSLVTALSDIPRRFVNLLQAVKDQKEQQT